MSTLLQSHQNESTQEISGNMSNFLGDINIMDKVVVQGKGETIRRRWKVASKQGEDIVRLARKILKGLIGG